MRRFLPLVFLLVALPLAAQDRPVLPDDAPAVAAPRINARDLQGYGGYFTVSGTTGGSAVEWSVEPRPKGVLFHQFPGAHALAFGGPPGTYTLTARVTSFKGKVTKLPKGWKEGDEVPLEITPDVQSVTATVILTGGEPGPGPVPPGPTPIPPGPTPVPPGPTPVPVDPLVQSLKAAAVADGWTPAKLAALASAFRAAADVTAAGRTAAESQQARKRVLAQSLPEGVPANLAAVCSAVQREADAFLPPADPTHVVTADDAAKVKAIYGRLAAACLEATR